MSNHILSLDYICKAPDGKEGNDINNWMAETGISSEHLSTLLMTLENDGYLGKTGTLLLEIGCLL